MKVKIEVQQKRKAIFKEVEVAFPIYVLSGYNHVRERSNPNTHQREESFGMTKIVSPTQAFTIRKQLNTANNSPTEVEYTFTAELTEPNTDESYFFPNKNTYDKPGTEAQWNELYAQLYTAIII